MRYCALLVAAAAASSLPAQVSGSINQDAPTVTSAIALADGARVEIRYTAIHYGKGEWQSILEDESKHEAFNALALRKPIGRVVTSHPVLAIDNLVPPGEYDVFFTVSSGNGWEINVKKPGAGMGTAIPWHVHLQDSKEEHKRLVLRLNAGDGANDVSFTIAFGKQIATIPLEIRRPAPPAEKPAKKEREPGKSARTPEAPAPVSGSLPDRRADEVGQPRLTGSGDQQPLREQIRADKLRVVGNSH